MSTVRAPRHARSEDRWADATARVPEVAAVMRRYLDQVGVSLRPASVVAADSCLRFFARFLADRISPITRIANVDREVIEDYKVHLAASVTRTGKPLAPNTIRQRLRMLNAFFDRLIDWEWQEAPWRNPIVAGDVPPKDQPLPKFLDDPRAARFMRAAYEEPDPFRRLCVLLLARTGMRVGELCALGADPVIRIGECHWLRIPVGKLRNDRYIPLHPHLVSEIAAHQRANAEYIAHHGVLLADRTGPINRWRVARMVSRVGRRAGVGHVHPHQLRHTLATQAINRGMRIEAVAALLGHKSLDMTMTYARIADRTVADEYFAVTEQVEALYTNKLEAAAEGLNMRRLRREHYWMLGNGWCTRPAEMDCHFESICETCVYFSTSIEFLPTLQRQRDHALKHDQPQRAVLFSGLLERLHEDGEE